MIIVSVAVCFRSPCFRWMLHTPRKFMKWGGQELTDSSGHFKWWLVHAVMALRPRVFSLNMCETGAVTQQYYMSQKSSFAISRNEALFVRNRDALSWTVLRNERGIPLLFLVLHLSFPSIHCLVKYARLQYRYPYEYVRYTVFNKRGNMVLLKKSLFCVFGVAEYVDML